VKVLTEYEAPAEKTVEELNQEWQERGEQQNHTNKTLMQEVFKCSL
jgi:hypothetical protein